MEQFSLEKYIENPNLLVVTRRGNPVRIICTDRKHGEDTLPIVFLEESQDGIGEFLLSCRADGTCDNYDTPYDLFFADKEEELTEFEKEVDAIIDENIKRNIGLKFEARNLIDLARKELEKDNVIIDKDRYIKICDQYYNNGKKNALKFLPKFKKGTPPSATTLYLIRKGYYMPLKEVDELFETLPKEE